MTAFLQTFMGKIVNGDLSEVSEKEISIAIFYELKDLNNQVENLEKKLETNIANSEKSISDLSVGLVSRLDAVDKKIENLEIFKTETLTYYKIGTIFATVLSIACAILTLYNAFKPIV
jgi:hypothetical protein